MLFQNFTEAPTYKGNRCSAKNMKTLIESSKKHTSMSYTKAIPLIEPTDDGTP